MEAVAMGIVGFGGRGAELGRLAREATGGLMETAAVVEPSDLRFEQGCEVCSSTPKRYRTAHEMLENEGIAVVVIASPDDEMCLIQFDNGVHAIYCQTFFTPRSFHHRDYQIIGDRALCT